VKTSEIENIAQRVAFVAGFKRRLPTLRYANNNRHFSIVIVVVIVAVIVLDIVFVILGTSFGRSRRTARKFL